MSGSKGARTSPDLIAACHVLHRLPAPRHPSEALMRLIDLARTHARGSRPAHAASDDVFISKPPLQALETPGEPFLHDVIPSPAGWTPGEVGKHGLLPQDMVIASERWWSRTVSNRRPHACKARALPTELRPLKNQGAPAVVGPGGLEPPTSRLSGVCSNQLSYRPETITPHHPPKGRVRRAGRRNEGGGPDRLQGGGLSGRCVFERSRKSVRTLEPHP